MKKAAIILASLVVLGGSLYCTFEVFCALGSNLETQPRALNACVWITGLAFGQFALVLFALVMKKDRAGS